MAEVLGIIGSVIGIIQVTTGLYKKYKKASSAQADIGRLQDETAKLSTVLENLQQLLQGPQGNKLPHTRLLIPALEDGCSQLEALNSELDSSGDKWPFKRSDVEERVQRLARFRQILGASLLLDQTEVMLHIDLKASLGRLPIAQGAAFDSHAEEHNPTCLPNTRVKLLQEINEWIQAQNAKVIFWLAGMAGTGKSTISRTLAHSVSARCLGASFFFKRGEGDRGDVSKFFTTIAAQLASRQPAIAPHIQAAIDSDPTIIGKAIREQFNKLILNPLSKLSGCTSDTLLIIVDALDECDQGKDIQLLIQLFSRLKEIKHLRLKVFLTSRPELPIRLGFKSVSEEYQNLVLHEVARTTIEQDIELFLRHEFTRIRAEHNEDHPEDGRLPQDWPQTADIQALTQMAVPLFVFAATVCRFVSNPWVSGDPRKRLKSVLNYQWSSQLEATYLPVLDQIAEGLGDDQRKKDKAWRRFRRVVGSIINLAYPLPASDLKSFFACESAVVLCRLHSVLSVPSSRHSDGPVRIFHLSFRDFLLDQSKREKLFWIDENKAHCWLAWRCQRVMKKFLHIDVDIFWAHTPGKFNTEGEICKIHEGIQRDLAYACCYWIYHLERCHARVSDSDGLLGFLTRYFLHWLAALGVMKKASESLALLGKLRDLVDVENGRNTITFLDDARRYIRATTSFLEVAPLQVYSSGLIFAPRTSEVRTHFEKKTPSWISLKPVVEAKWNAQYLTLEGHRKEVHFATFSPDGTLIASASEDKTVRIWDTTTGRCQITLEGHGGSVKLVTFSRNGKMLASASDDRSIRLWDAETGECKHALEGHAARISSVAFTHDDTNLESVSDNGTVWIWDVARGGGYKELTNRTPITFSPDSTLSVSAMEDFTIRLREERVSLQRKPEDEDDSGGTGPCPSLPTSYMTEVTLASHDRTVRLWDKTKGDFYQNPETHCYKELKGHTNRVTSFAFSPQGTTMASASEDQTIRLWDTKTGAFQQELRGHGERVSCVTFSPDNKFMASASADKTIKFWEVKAEDCQETLQGHNDRINRVMFSPNGTVIASASDDNTIGLWDPKSGDCRRKLEGHSERVHLVAFSPDSGTLASVSADKTVRLWDVAAGTCHETLEGHTDDINWIAFSPSSKVVATASDDMTVRLWDVETGICQQTLKGHSHDVTWVTFSPDRKVLASASYDYTVRLWDPETGDFLRVLKGHGNYVHSAVFSPDSNTLASASEDWTVQLWEARTGNTKILRGHIKACKLVTFSPESDVIASASADETVRLWATESGTCLQTIKIGILTCSLSFNEEGTCVLTDIGAIIRNGGGQAVSTMITTEETASSRSETPKPQVKQGLGISEDRCWITRNDDRLLWLPTHVRPDKFAVRGPVVAMGNSLGKVVIMGFAEDIMEWYCKPDTVQPANTPNEHGGGTW